MTFNSFDHNHAIAIAWLEFEDNCPRDIALRCVVSGLTEVSLVKPPDLAEVASPERITHVAALLSPQFPDMSVRGNTIWLSSSSLLQCRSIGALLWLLPDAAGVYPESEVLTGFQMVAKVQALPLWQIVQSVEQPVEVVPFDVDAVLLQIFLAQSALADSTRFTRQRRSHAIGIVLIFLVVSLAGFWFASDKPWQAFLIAVIYAPLLIAAVLTLLLVVQRLKAFLIARFR